MEKKLFIAQITKPSRVVAARLYYDLKARGYETETAFEKNTLRAQITRARLAGIRWVAIIGLKEYYEHTILLKDMKERQSVSLTYEQFLDYVKFIYEEET